MDDIAIDHASSGPRIHLRAVRRALRACASAGERPRRGERRGVWSSRTHPRDRFVRRSVTAAHSPCDGAHHRAIAMRRSYSVTNQPRGGPCHRTAVTRLSSLPRCCCVPEASAVQISLRRCDDAAGGVRAGGGRNRSDGFIVLLLLGSSCMLLKTC